MILSYYDIELIAENILRDYGYSPESDTPLNVENFAIKHLGLSMVYDRLSVYGDILGLTTHADADIIVPYIMYPKTIHAPPNTLLIDTSLLPEYPNDWRQRGRYRFTVAHECAHQILFRAEPDERQKSLRQLEPRPYSARELNSKSDWCEWQANALAAALLMPRRKVARLMGVRRLTRYGSKLNRPDDLFFHALLSAFDVSKTALTKRLLQLELMFQCSYSDYYDPTDIMGDEQFV
ncbi:MAG: ImmA/IrrE family metallo-endopeptidase [Oscillospiraceae bacterium]|nr:ImmA/IrrE family metallo-endopeptidase [Oscillospiraceae bacterium]